MFCIFLTLAWCFGAMAQQPEEAETYQSPLYNRIDHILLSPDGQMLVASDSTGHLLFWGRDGGLRKILRTHLEPIDDIAISSNGAYLATARHYEIIVWDFMTGEKVNSIRVNSKVLGVSFSSNGATLLYASPTGMYKLSAREAGNPEKMDGSLPCSFKNTEWKDALICGFCADGLFHCYDWDGSAFNETGNVKYEAADLKQVLVMDQQRVVMVNANRASILNNSSRSFSSLKGLPQSFTAIGYGSEGVFYAGDHNGRVVSFKPTVEDEKILEKKAEKQAEVKPEINSSGMLAFINGREVKAQQKIEVTDSSLDIYVWDDEHEDGDTISLNLNGDWVLQDHLITSEKKKLSINLIPGKANYLILYAKNLGKLPPNTAVISFNDGKGDQKLTLESDMKRSEAVHFILKQ